MLSKLNRIVKNAQDNFLVTGVELKNLRKINIMVNIPKIRRCNDLQRMKLL